MLDGSERLAMQDLSVRFSTAVRSCSAIELPEPAVAAPVLRADGRLEDLGLPYTAFDFPRLRARYQISELRVADLRFSPHETAAFLNDVMRLDLSAADVEALETRTEGWIAGLQLAALSMQGQKDTTGFIDSFTGSHRFVLDYLVEEVLGRQPERIQTFLLRTSILDRMCGPLCDAILVDASEFFPGQETLESLERANLFIIPLDDERRWYRYHHLFAERPLGRRGARGQFMRRERLIISQSELNGFYGLHRSAILR